VNREKWREVAFAWFEISYRSCASDIGQRWRRGVGQREEIEIATWPEAAGENKLREERK